MKVSETNYVLAIVTEDGTQYDISDFAEDLGWEENEKELATSMSFSVGTDNPKLNALVKIGCVALVLVAGDECARAVINKAKQKKSGDKVSMTVSAYDELYPLQTSEDQLYFSAGQTTKAVLTQIFDEWGITLGKYDGADATHEKLVFRTGSLADSILDILDDAVKKGGSPSVLRASKGQIEVVKRGGNQTVYLFDEDDTISVEQETSITEIVTRVKIVGKEDATEGLPPVEAVLNGLTEFGIRQRIYTREKDATTEEAQAAAKAILDEKGKVSTTMTVKAPDVPEMRKGDAVFVHIGVIADYYYVAGIRHDATTGTMTLDLKEFPMLEKSIDKLADLGVLNSPDYWKEHAEDTAYVDALIEKSAAVITENGPRCASVEEGVKALTEAGIITTPAYWIDKGGNVGELIKALGGAVLASGASVT